MKKRFFGGCCDRSCCTFCSVFATIIFTTAMWYNQNYCAYDNVDGTQKNQTNFVIISAGFNNGKWCEKSLDSVFSQTFPWKDFIIIDDASTDGSAEVYKRYLREHPTKLSVKFIKNKVHRDKLANIYDAIHSCDPHDIIIMLDADDWFVDCSVLEYLHSVYQSGDVWLTYGQCMTWPVYEGESQELPNWVIELNAVRIYPFVTSHLKTFYAGLFQKIKREDLIWNGGFIRLIDDVAFMIPMIEMAGKHSRFLSKLLYIVNLTSSIEHRKRHRDDGTDQSMWPTEVFIRQRPRYARIQNPF